MPPNLSIITPVKNAAAWLVDCILSVQSQDFTNWEWIFVNDHSSDASVEILRAEAKKDSRIRVLQNPKTGIIPALQKALNQAAGTYITRMDADDLMPPTRLSTMLNALKTAPPKTIITGKIKYISQAPVSAGYLRYQNWLNQLCDDQNHWQHVYRECVVASPNWLMRSKELRNMGGFDALQYPEDYDLCFAWHKHDFRIKALTKTTLLWREHPLRTSRHSPHYQQTAFFSLKLKRFAERNYTTAHQVALFGLGKKARLSAALLSSLNIPFHWFAQKQSVAKIGDNTFAIKPLHAFKTLNNPLVLLSVYPAQAERKALEKYLNNLNLQLGKNYWYL